jgi:hypothetical protein
MGNFTPAPRPIALSTLLSEKGITQMPKMLSLEGVHLNCHGATVAIVAPYIIDPQQ